MRVPYLRKTDSRINICGYAEKQTRDRKCSAQPDPGFLAQEGVTAAACCGSGGFAGRRKRTDSRLYPETFHWAIFSFSSGVMFQTKRNTAQLPTAQRAGNSRHSTLMPKTVLPV